MRVKVHSMAGVGLALFLTLASGLVQAQSVTIDAFYGVWHGSAISESQISTNFRLTSRDLNVELRPANGNGFTLEWATIQRKKGDPSNPTEKIKVQTATFLPAGQSNLWKADGSGDVMDAGYSYARLHGQTLSIYSMETADDGSLEVHIYRRTLSALGMELIFTRLVDGQPVRTVKGRLVKFAN